eukprot:190219_1
MPVSIKRRKTGLFNPPENEDKLRAKISDFILLIGADQKGLNCSRINKILNDNKNCNWIESWRFVDIFCRKWIYHFLDEDEKSEADNINDKDIINYFNKCGAKLFHHWLPRIRARSNSVVYSAGKYEQFYADNNKEARRKTPKRKKKKKKRRTNMNNNSNNNPNSNDNDSDQNEFNIQELDDEDLDDFEDSDSDTGDETEEDDYQKLQRRKARSLFKKRNKTSQEDMVTLIIAEQYNKAGLESDKMIAWIRAFCRNKDLKITDLRSIDQLDKSNYYLPQFTLKLYFRHFIDQKKGNTDKLILENLANDCFACLNKEYILQVLPQGLNNQIFALINNDTRPNEMLIKLKTYLEDAKKDDDFKMTWSHISRPLICIEKALTGVCLNYLNCQKNHNACIACFGPHHTGECPKLSWKIKKMVSLNHSWNFKNFRKVGNNNNNNYYNRNKNNRNNRNNR